MKQLKTVLKFEYNSYIKNKAFIVITLLFAAVIIIGMNAPGIVDLVDSMRSSGTVYYEDGQPVISGVGRDAAIYDPLEHFSNELLRGFFPNYNFERLNSFDIEHLESRVADGTFEFALAVNGIEYTLVQTSGGMFDFTLLAVPGMVRNVYIENLYSEFGLVNEQIERIHFANPSGTYVLVGRDMAQTFWVGYVMLILLFMTIQFYGQFVMTSVVTEKSSKAMELLITSVKPVHLMFGKVLGSGLAGLTQLVVFLVSAVVIFQLTSSQWYEFSPMVYSLLGMSLNFEILAFALIFFLLGFFMFSFLFAGFGSTVSRLEDAQKVAMAPLLLFMASFFIAMFVGMSAPESTFYVVASFVPFLSPLVMFMRICLVGVGYGYGLSMIEVIIAIVINIVSIVAVGVLCAKIYRAGVLMYGKPMSIIEIFKQLIKA